VRFRMDDGTTSSVHQEWLRLKRAGIIKTG
jgi:hypothetical protein